MKHKEIENFRTVHKLVVEINRAAPALLLNVIPQIEEELKVCTIYYMAGPCTHCNY